MKICFLEGDMSRKGGTEKMTSLLANDLCSKYEVIVLSLSMCNEVVFFPLNEKIRFLTISEGNILSQIFSIRKILKQERINILINVDIGTGYYGILAATRLSIKVITWEHGNFYNNWRSKVFPLFRKFAAKYSDTIVVLTEKDKQNYCSNLKMKKPIHVIANPAVCHDYIYNSSSKVILSAGQLLKIKGYERVIEVARKILFKYPDWKWVICGEGPERQKLEKLILDAKLTNQVLLLGTVDDMDSQYKNAAMYVLTSDMEGLPMVLLEAKSWGLPLVSFDIMTGPSDVIIDEVNGYLIKPYDIDAMAEKIEILISDKDKRVQFSANAQMDMQKFEEKYIISQWETIIGVE